MIIDEYREEFIYLNKLLKSGDYTKMESRKIVLLWIKNYESDDYE